MILYLFLVVLISAFDKDLSEREDHDPDFKEIEN
jgi:hypothetical protein